MQGWTTKLFSSFPRGLAAGACLLAALWLLPTPAPAQTDPEQLAEQIAKSLSAIRDPRYRTAAFSRVRDAGGRININELIDFANVKIVRERRLKVIDRSKLALILKEQQVQLSDFVSAKKYEELGKLLGVDLFIYGTIYNDALVLKAIDVQSSAIAWADVFPVSGGAQEARLLLRLGGGVVNSLRKDLARLKTARIRQVSFWNLSPTDPFLPEALMDYISVAIVQDGNLQVVDRENIQLIAKEQQLNQAMFIDEKNAKQLGELYGVDAFVYGGVSRRPDGTIVASLKMMNIFNGVIEWADLIKVDEKDGAQQAAMGGKKAGTTPPGMAFIPAGPFMMGTDGDPKQAQPVHSVNVGGYFLDITEVTNEDYLQFVSKQRYRAPVGWNGGSMPPGSEKVPVVGVSWEDARRYCRFMRKRLPTEAEWEKAARGAQGQPFPWSGSAFSPSYTVTRESGRKSAVSVLTQTRDISPYGVRFMAGNVREWVQSPFDSFPGSTAPFKSNGKRVIRGSSWAKNHHSARTFHREGSNPNLAWQDVGFRCAKSQ